MPKLGLRFEDPGFESSVDRFGVGNSEATLSTLEKLGLEEIDVTTEIKSLQKRPHFFNIKMVIRKTLKAIIQIS